MKSVSRAAFIEVGSVAQSRERGNILWVEVMGNPPGSV